MGMKSRKRMRVKATRKQKNPRKRPRIDGTLVGEQAVAAWDSTKTLKQNCESIGVKSNPNSLQESESTSKKVLINDPPEEAVREPQLSYSEGRYYKCLYEKYGEDFRSMSRDMDLNFYQHPVGVLKKKINLYVSIYHENEEMQAKLSEREKPPTRVTQKKPVHLEKNK